MLLPNTKGGPACLLFKFYFDINFTTYENDLEDSLDNELVQFAEQLKMIVAGAIGSTKNEGLEIQHHEFLLDNSLESRFLYLEITLCIYLSLMISNCSVNVHFRH